jgi:tRNA A37 methylthiotransferase MiaB
MLKKKISLVQPNFQQGPKELNAYYLPYSIGVLWAYTNQFPTIIGAYEIALIQWKREQLEPTARKLAFRSDVVCFSTYVWNRNYNYALAKRIRELNPDAVIIFGGPEPPITDPKIFERFPFIDLVVKGEGEITFKRVLESMINAGPDFDKIPGLLYKHPILGTVDTGEPERIADLNDLPSPYTTGFFDQIVADNPEVEWNATLETNRGCPYQCTFCDWGSLTYNKVKKFKLERVYADLEWIAKNKCGFMAIADANFGMFVERDNSIVDKIIALQHEYGFPYTFNVSWAKNQKADVIGLVKKLIDTPSFNHGLTLSVQSLNDDVLDAIKRKNLDINKIEKVFTAAEKQGIPVATELILGLPNETLKSWKNNIWRLLEAGNHTGIEFLQAQLLENAEMNTDQRSFYKLQSVTVYDYMSGSYNDDVLAEGVDAVISTRNMPTADMLDAQVFNWFINTFHVNGLTTYVARFLRKRLNISYEDFYTQFYNLAMVDSWFAKERDEVRGYYESWMANGRINHPRIGKTEIHGWNLIHRTVINIHANNRYADVFRLLQEFCIRFDLPLDELTDVLRLQTYHIVQYNKIKQYPLVMPVRNDIFGYLHGNELKRNAVYKFKFDEPGISFDRFLELIYFGRRRNFGKAKLTVIYE